MAYFGCSPLVRSARLAWPLGWLACAQGVDSGSDPIDAAQDATGGTVGGEQAPEAAALDSGVDADGTSDAADGAPWDADTGTPSEAGPEGGADASPVASRRVFVSSAAYDGALGGYAGGDARCQALATAAALGGTWMAWLSDTSSSPGARFSKATVGYALVDGTPVAASWTALSSGGLTHAIDVTETGESLATATATASKTWTATVFTGALGAPSCSDFASNAATQTGEVGHCTGTGTVNWTSAYLTEACNVQNHLYCFEQ
jgi:hypothetical protein